jgi:hypothetical protein
LVEIEDDAAILRRIGIKEAAASIGVLAIGSILKNEGLWKNSWVKTQSKSGSIFHDKDRGM